MTRRREMNQLMHKGHQILDFGFWILDFLPAQNPKSKIQNPKSSKGQALLEISILGLLLGGLLAGVVDFGRAYYTSIVVAQMAGEGAAYAAWYPDRDLNYPTAGTCAHLAPESSKSIQDRAGLVAQQHGMVIEHSQVPISIQKP